MASGVLIGNDAIEQIAQSGFAFLDASVELQRFIEQALQAGDGFFELDAEAKLDSSLPLDSGYRSYGKEYSQSSTHPDEVESFTVSHRLPEAEVQLSGAAADLHSKMVAVFSLLEDASEEIAQRLHLELYGQPINLEKAFHEWSLLQLNFARPTDVDAEFINDVHEDGCLLTLMSLAGDGLELQVGDQFIPIPSSKTQVLAMAGEILWLLTGGHIKPVYHRVRTIRSCPKRRSLLLFADMNPSFCEPWVVNETNRSINIGKKVRQNSTRFGLSEWSE